MKIEGGCGITNLQTTKFLQHLRVKNLIKVTGRTSFLLCRNNCWKTTALDQRKFQYSRLYDQERIKSTSRRVWFCDESKWNWMITNLQTTKFLQHLRVKNLIKVTGRTSFLLCRNNCWKTTALDQRKFQYSRLYDQERIKSTSRRVWFCDESKWNWMWNWSSSEMLHSKVKNLIKCAWLKHHKTNLLHIMSNGIIVKKCNKYQLFLIILTALFLNYFNM